MGHSHRGGPAARPDRQAHPGPDFLGIGAQKAGTTWIHDQLNAHPDVWVPPTKELHYFDSACPNEALLGVEPYPHAGLRPKLRAFRNRPGPSTLRWLRRFARHDGTAIWYRGLFADTKAPVSGEITPAYSTLDERGVRFARQVLRAGCRVFLVVRHPTDRTWSSFKMYYRWLDRPLDSVSPETAVKFASDARNRLRTDYPRMVRSWRRQFNDDFRVFLFDDLLESSTAFLDAICRFLGLTPLDPDEVSGGRSNADPSDRSMPREIRAALDEYFHDEVTELDALVPGVANRWGR